MVPILQLIPNRLKKFVRVQFESIRKKEDSLIPKMEISGKHISNLIVIQNRTELLKLLPKNAIVAEIGVDKGEFSEEIMAVCKPEKLHLIDVWDSKRYHHGLMAQVQRKFEDQIKNGCVEINLGFSTDVGAKCNDHYFDWIYIDTDHSYLTTKSELEIFSQKLKSGGIIAGHDFVQGNWITGYRYGVIEAVYEFCNAFDWEILYLTMEINTPRSFAIRKRKEV
ncbi:MAG: class I SAM-dependent methyltransferase [Flavitalea sp.]